MKSNKKTAKFDNIVSSNLVQITDKVTEEKLIDYLVNQSGDDKNKFKTESISAATKNRLKLQKTTPGHRC